jgi:hypothetical protein
MPIKQKAEQRFAQPSLFLVQYFFVPALLGLTYQYLSHRLVAVGDILLHLFYA